MYVQPHLACGFIKSLFGRIGWNYDDFIVSLTRGFGATKSASKSDNAYNKGGGLNDDFKHRHEPLPNKKNKQPFQRRSMLMMICLAFMEWNFTVFLGLLQYIPILRTAVQLIIPLLRMIL